MPLPPIQYPDLSAILARGESIKRSRAERRAASMKAQAEQAAAARRGEAVRAYQAGNPDLLKVVDPELHARLEKSQMERATKQKELGDARTLASSKMLEQGTQALAAQNFNPEFHQRFGESIQRREEQGSLVPGTFDRWQGEFQESKAFTPPATEQSLTELVEADDAQLAQMRAGATAEKMQPRFSSLSQQAELERVGLEDPEKMDPYHRYFTEAATRLGYGPRSPKGEYEAAWQDPKIHDMINTVATELGTQRKNKNTVNLRIGPDGTVSKPLSKPMEAQLDKEIGANLKMLGSVRQVMRLAKPEQFTLKGRAAHKIGSWASHLDPTIIGDASRSDFMARAAMLYEVEQLFNEYRRKITGAAASVQELAALRKSMFNVDQDWNSFIAGIGQFYGRVTRELRLARRLEMNGIPLGKISDRQISEAMVSGDPARTKEDRDYRMDQLLSDGHSAESIAEIMEYEGYTENSPFSEL